VRGRRAGGIKQKAAPVIAVAGSTGAVGVEFLKLMEERNTPVGELRLLASARSAGKTQKFRGKVRCPPAPLFALVDDA